MAVSLVKVRIGQRERDGGRWHLRPVRLYAADLKEFRLGDEGQQNKHRHRSNGTHEAIELEIDFGARGDRKSRHQRDQTEKYGGRILFSRIKVGHKHYKDRVCGSNRLGQGDRNGVTATHGDDKESACEEVAKSDLHHGEKKVSGREHGQTKQGKEHKAIGGGRHELHHGNVERISDVEIKTGCEIIEVDAGDKPRWQHQQ